MDVNVLQSQAVNAFHAGRYRESADTYWKAFLCLPRTHDVRYHILHGCTSTLRLNYVETNESDFENMQKLFEDKSEPRLFRLEAAHTLGVMHHDRQERMKCQEVYHHAITIGGKKLSDKEKRKEEKTMQVVFSPNGKMERKSMKELTKGVLNDCQKNLDQLNASTRGAPGVTFSPQGNPTERSHYMPIGQGGTSLTSEMINNLIDVGGIQCDYCKKKGVKLMVCSLCNKGYYCSKECQKKQWKEREHKIYCRKEGQFEVGDLVQCARLKKKPEINGHILRIVGRDEKSTEERYKLRMEGAVAGDNTISIKSENLNQLRPYDCRI